jgi:hypothetical protein
MLCLLMQAVSREVVSGVPMQISTRHVEKAKSLTAHGLAPLNPVDERFSKKLDNHIAAVSLYVAHFNLCRVHETLRTTPGVAIGVADHVWSIGERRRAGDATD